MLSTLRRAPLPVTLVIFTFLCPTELSLFLDGLRLPPHRVSLLILFPFALYRLLTASGLRIRSFDILFIAFNIWTVAVYVQHDGMPGGLVYGGSLALEGLGAYLVARAYIRDVPTLKATLNVMAIAIGVAALIALPETLLGQTFTHDLLRQLTGYHHPTAIESRLGLTRAYGTFDHPIHYGTFCAGLLALFWFAETERRRRWKRAGLVSGATFLGISSAPLLCLALQIGMMIWERLTRGLTSRLALTLSVIAGLYIGISLVSTRGPIAIIATGMTIDSWTGYYRLKIWEHGLANVWANPWMGIGLAEWDRPWWMVSSTVDAFWLVVAMRQGIPSLLLLAAAILLMGYMVLAQRASRIDPLMPRLVKGWLMSLIALSLIGCTVHFWNVLYAYFFFFVGLGGCLADPIRARQTAATATNAPRRRVRRAPLRRPDYAPEPVGVRPPPATVPAE